MEKKFKELSLFKERHIGSNEAAQKKMLEHVGFKKMDDLIQATVPDIILNEKSLNLPEALTEEEILLELKEVSKLNTVNKSYIGLGYYNTSLPTVIQRNILENPGWYTQYTPYQAEISQGRLEALLNFQTMIQELTAMDVSNASLLDEATAAAEAMTLLLRSRKKSDLNKNKFLVSDSVFPHTIELVKTRAKYLDLEIVVGNPNDLMSDEFFGVLIQTPDSSGEIADLASFVELAKKNAVRTIIASDLLSLCIVKPPGEFGVDIVIGSTQRFGVPMGYGGPHAAFLASKDEFKRQIPGRIIGVSKDAAGNKALRMALQTREQHIRRDKATSNICTAQALLAIIAGFYALYHGPNGLKDIATRVQQLASTLEKGLKVFGYTQLNKNYFDTLKIKLDSSLVSKLKNFAEAKGINFRYYDDGFVGISLDETTRFTDIKDILSVFATLSNVSFDDSSIKIDFKAVAISKNLLRTTSPLSHPVFQKYHTETELLRYMKRLENKDLSLTLSMIPLGSCTMKLNASTQMIPISWPEFSQIHPFVPINQAAGYQKMIKQLEEYLCEITQLEACSLQPNSGAQGEYAGLLAIKEYFVEKGESQRDKVLIPVSAHGTNPASASLANLKVVLIKCDEQGNIDTNDLLEKAEKHKDTLAALMITYPSTHGVFEESILEIIEVVHRFGGQVYMDGANMNAQVGITSPGRMGADVCHLNLHKTFAIPHGGGGPGVGPICVAKHLSPHLPGHNLVPQDGRKGGMVSASPWGSASILLISYSYIRMLGTEGLRKSTEVAILNANYIASRLKEYYPVLYKGKNNMVAHELIIDVRGFKASAGVEVDDIAKRLIDYSFHSPTMSWPVPGTLMIEPTESESLEELDRFCNAMISIREEIQEIVDGKFEKDNNVLKNSPHTIDMFACNDNYPYPMAKALYPLNSLREWKFYTPVRRIDNAFGDRNLVCSCPPIESYQEG